MDMKERLQELAENARKRIEESEGLDKLNDVRVAYLGKKGELTVILKGMKDVAPEERPKVGQLVNETRAKIEELLEASKKDFEEKVREEKMKAEVIDVTLPAKKAKDRSSPSVILSLWKKLSVFSSEWAMRLWKVRRLSMRTTTLQS